MVPERESTLRLPFALPKAAFDLVAIGVATLYRRDRYKVSGKSLNHAEGNSWCETLTSRPEDPRLAALWIEVASTKNALSNALSGCERRKKVLGASAKCSFHRRPDSIMRSDHGWLGCIGGIFQESVTCAIVWCWCIYGHCSGTMVDYFTPRDLAAATAAFARSCDHACWQQQYRGAATAAIHL